MAKSVESTPVTGIPQLVDVVFENRTPGRVAEPNPWIDILKNLPLDPNREGWSVTRGFIASNDDAKGYLNKLARAAAALNTAVARQTVPNDTDAVIVTPDKVKIPVGKTLIRFATRPPQPRKPKTPKAAE